ncbi:DUF6147 family protein [Blautia sp. XA-2221]|uniref:DUF6147 family protein n=1 Tax=Blautia sp. XA-2221 TaxID=2903961 RepID=UPI0023785C51|nr:DUF6147 family protein [Blautia sp. XA-2221]
MISRWKRMLGISLVAGILAVGNTAVVSAQSLSIMDELETTADYAEDTSYSLLRGNHLNFGTVKVQRISSNEIGIYGVTQCHHACDKVYLSLYLERKVNGSYGTYKYWEFTADDATSLSRGLNVAVPSGTYYRVRGYHAAKDGTIKESTSTLTSGILIK